MVVKVAPSWIKTTITAFKCGILPLDEGTVGALTVSIRLRGLKGAILSLDEGAGHE
jgi:hypothetical protein